MTKFNYSNEYIVEGSKNLKKIELYLTPDGRPNYFRPNVDDATAIVSRYMLRPNIGSLNAVITNTNDYTLLMYITHKFSQLQCILLSLEDKDPLFDLRIVSRLQDFVSTIDRFSITGLSVNQNNIIEPIGSFYEKTSKPGSQNLYIDYCDDGFQNVERSLRIRKEVSRGGEIKTILGYSTEMDFEWASYMDFIKKCGKSIGILRFDVMLNENPLGRSELPANFFPQVITNCPNLRKLHIEGCILKHFVYSQVESNEKFSINELCFRYCQIQYGMLEQFFVLLDKIEQLILFDNSNHFPENEPLDEATTAYSHPIISLPHYNVNQILIGGSSEIIHVKVRETTDNTFYYYQFDTTQYASIKSSTEQEFAANNDDQHVYVCCPRKLKLAITVEEDYYSLYKYILLLI